MKDGVRQVIGKTISSVVVGKSERDLRFRCSWSLTMERTSSSGGHISVVPVGSIAAGSKKLLPTLRNSAARSRRYIPGDRAQPMACSGALLSVAPAEAGSFVGASRRRTEGLSCGPQGINSGTARKPTLWAVSSEPLLARYFPVRRNEPALPH